MWCNPCRAVGMIHCAYPDECGNMLSGKAAADNWKAWLDDLPLDGGFAEGIDQVQDFISGTVARAEAAEAKVAELEAQIARMIDADTVQKMLDIAQPIMAEACRGYEEAIATLRAENERLRGAAKALCDAVEADDGSDHHYFTISGLAKALRAELDDAP